MRVECDLRNKPGVTCLSLYPSAGGDGVVGVLSMDQPGDPLIGAPVLGTPSPRVSASHPRWYHRAKADAVGTSLSLSLSLSCFVNARYMTFDVV